jgi:hypothetical protein
MGPGRGLWRSALAGSALLLRCQRALALPQVNEVVPPPASAWVTVDNSGVPVTIHPVVMTTNGAVTTASPPPAYLLSTATYTMLPSGLASTKTGLPPVATASGPDEEGNFLACTKYQGPGGPFCQPEPGTLLYPGSTYYGMQCAMRNPSCDGRLISRPC